MVGGVLCPVSSPSETTYTQIKVKIPAREASTQDIQVKVKYAGK